MPGDIVCINGPFTLVLDFVEVDSSDFRVLVRFQVSYAGFYQRFNWEINQLWIEYEELRRFEHALQEAPLGRLHDMSDYPILQFERDTSGERLTINPPAQRQSREGEALAIALRIDDGSIRTLHRAFSEFAKWW